MLRCLGDGWFPSRGNPILRSGVNEPDFYMASTEGYGMEEPRRCWKIKRLATVKRKDFLLVRIDPPLPGQKYGLQGRDIDVVLVATRHQGASLFPITRWPE
jgi:hypothetical protein